MNFPSLASCSPRCRDCRPRRNEGFTPPARAGGLDPEFSLRSSRIGRRQQAAGSRQQAAGSSVVHEGQANARLFTFWAHWVFRYKSLSDSRHQILHFLLPGDLVGLQQELDNVVLHGVEALKHIANALGLSQLHANKTLRRPSALGLHDFKNGSLRLLNPPRAGAHCHALRNCGAAQAVVVSELRGAAQRPVQPQRQRR